jgi:copper chaperone NosL
VRVARSDRSRSQNRAQLLAAAWAVRVERVPPASRLRVGLAALLALTLAACGGGPPRPVELDTRNEACAFCRMKVSDARFASQLVAPGELPHFFDDLGCLAGYLKENAALPQAVAFAADHRTKTWIRAEQAVYTRVPGLATPMGSHLVAHADAASRDADPDARGGTAVSASELLAAAAPAGSSR